jgi:hypothetical protein
VGATGLEPGTAFHHYFEHGDGDVLGKHCSFFVDADLALAHGWDWLQTCSAHAVFRLSSCKAFIFQLSDQTRP